ncbi:MAG: phenylalanine--tRNA ligase subunit beta [Candidatus Altiarchaeota archaeon]
MPTVEFKFKELCSFLGKNFKPDELKERISMLGVDLERIDENKIVMEIFPNRPDLLSIEGFSRALKGVLNIESGLKYYHLFDSDTKIFVDKSVENVRPYIVGTIIKNISMDENFLISLMDLQEKLHVTHGRNRRKVAIGVHDFSKVKPNFTYKAVKPKEISFLPLDMSEEMTLEKILKKHPKGKEYSFILEGKERYPVLIDKNKNVLSFPPIINAELTRVTYETKEIFIDITGLDEIAINQALNIVTTSIAERSKEAKIYSVEIIKV